MKARETHKYAENIQTIKRMPQYLRLFNKMLGYGRDYISSVQIAQETGLRPILIKKDLLMVGAPGKTKLGYNVKGTVDAIETYLGWHDKKDVCLVGYGKLGAALFNYEGFKKHGFNIVAAFDCNAEKIAQEAQHNLYPINQLTKVIQENKISTAIIAVPATAAQGVADTLVNAGVKAVWNFSPVDIKVPEDVIIQNEDLSVGLALLCSRLKN
jgi:redox-sensing transcriptional repressor